MSNFDDVGFDAELLQRLLERVDVGLNLRLRSLRLRVGFAEQAQSGQVVAFLRNRSRWVRCEARLLRRGLAATDRFRLRLFALARRHLDDCANGLRLFVGFAEFRLQNSSVFESSRSILESLDEHLHRHVQAEDDSDHGDCAEADPLRVTEQALETPSN
ncbi:MAG: hypothetical protein AKCLJLPJ_02475 [Fimbriimonadales bacterium]|nr:hypothetical protein [Fimbriimonadales bacterium]